MKPILVKITIKSFFLIIFYFAVSQWNMFFLGGLIFFISGYQYPLIKKTHVIMDVFIPIILFIAIFIGNFYLSGISSGWGMIISFASYYFIIFTVSYLFAFSIKYFIKNTSVKKLVFFAIVSILIYRVSIFVSHPFAAVVLGIITFWFSFLLFKENKIKKYIVYTSFTVPYALIYLFVGDIFELSIIVLLYIFVNIIISNLAVLFYKEKRISRVITFTSLIFLVVFQLTFYVFILNWSEYVFTKDTVLPDKLKFSENFYNNENQLLDNDIFENKIVVLSFWTSACKYCFENFPDFQKLFSKYQNDIVIIAVGLPFDHQTISDLDTLIAKYDYDFPVIYSKKGLNYFNTKYNTPSVPSAIILDNNGNIIFNNNYNTNPLLWVNNIDKIIETKLEPNSFK